MIFSDDFHDILSYINPRRTFGRAGNEFTRRLQIADKVVFGVTIAVDAIHIGRAIHTDCTTARNRRPGKHTAKASAKVARGWALSSVGSAAGTTVGTMFGGIGAVPGGIIGGWVGSFAGSVISDVIMDRFL